MNDRLHTANLVLRPPVGGDWPAFRDFMLSDRAQSLGGPVDLGRAWRNFAAELGHWQIHGHGMWAVTRRDGDDTALALIGPWYPADWPETEVGWMVLSPDEEGRGLAAEAAAAAITHAWHVLGWKTVVSYIAPENARSIALAERLGARVDPDAPQPRLDTPCLVYRHPRPEDASSARRTLSDGDLA